MIYLDNAATTLIKPPAVARAMIDAMRSCASPGRGGHAAAMRAARLAPRCGQPVLSIAAARKPRSCFACRTPITLSSP